MKKIEIDERELYDVKWFDYRHLAPDTATLLFMREWATGLIDYNEEVRGTRFINFLRKFESFKIEALKKHNARHWRQMELLRQWVDKNGWQYSEYWSFAFPVFRKMGFERMYPNMFLNKDVKKRVVEAITDRRQAVITVSKQHLFHADNWKGYEIQRDYYAYLLNRVVGHYATRHEILVKLGELVKRKKLAMPYLKENMANVLARHGK